MVTRQLIAILCAVRVTKKNNPAFTKCWKCHAALAVDDEHDEELKQGELDF
jgi:hypothetical protein